MKKLLISLLVGFILFSTMPIYALTFEEAKKYEGKYILLEFKNPLFPYTYQVIGKVLVISEFYKYGRFDLVIKLTTPTEGKNKVFSIPIDIIITIEETENEEKPKIIER